MIVEKQKTRRERVIEIFEAIGKISNMSLPSDVKIDLGFLLIEYQPIVKDYNERLVVVKTAVFEENGLDPKKVHENVDPTKRKKVQDEINEKLKEILNEEIEVSIPIFTKAELKKFGKDSEKKSNPFDPPFEFFQLLGKELILEK